MEFLLMKKNRWKYRVNELESKGFQVDVAYTHRVLRSMFVDDRRPRKSVQSCMETLLNYRAYS